ncbi:MAG TPA: SLC13 family permease [Candidatus Limnocylindrales bacterium]|nr:SLC13 family permease [Candidatus Limnocylindrales bacterium]
MLADTEFAERWRDRPDFLLVTPVHAGPGPTASMRGRVALVTLPLLAAAAAGWLPILHAALLGALGLVALRVLSPREARDAVDLDVLVVIAGSFGLGAAVEQSGLARELGVAIVDGFGGLGWRAVLLGVVAATLVLTEFISNNAAAALMFPIALAAAADVGADERAFAIAVAVSASASFLTPVGYQTNTMVLGPGGYRFSDYVRVGAPLTAVVVAVVVATA